MKLDLFTKRNTILLFCLVVLFGTGCLKPAEDHNVRWQGKVLEKVTKKGVANAKIYLYERKVDLLGSSGGILIETYQSDKDGNFSIDYTYRVNYGYLVKVFADKYYESEDYIPSEKKGVATTTELFLDPYAWIKFHVKNVNPYDENDKIDINGDCLNKLLIGNALDTTYVCDGIGNMPTDFVWWATKNSTKIKYNDTIPFLKAHDTTYFEIKY